MVKLVITVAVLLAVYSYICVKGYKNGRQAGYRHSAEQVIDLEADLVQLTESLPDYSKKRFRENMFHPTCIRFIMTEDYSSHNPYGTAYLYQSCPDGGMVCLGELTSETGTMTPLK